MPSAEVRHFEVGFLKDGFIETEKAFIHFFLHWLHQNSSLQYERILLRSYNKTQDAILSRHIPKLMTKTNGERKRDEERREQKRRQEKVREVEGWIGWFRGVAVRQGQRATCTSPFCLLLQGQLYHFRNKAVDRKICCFDFTLSSPHSLHSVLLLLLSPVPLCALHSPCLSTQLSFLHQFVWHVPVLIVQAEPLARFKICIRMLFFISQQAEACGVSFELLGKQMEVFTLPLWD